MDMTKALCLNCGEIKWGALIPCPHCGAPDCGDMDINIYFSDHNFKVDNLEKIGTILKEVVKIDEKDKVVLFWTFMKYMADNYPNIVKKLNLELATQPERIKKVEKHIKELEIGKMKIKRRGWF
jgi:hypothetical protein